MTTGVYKRIIGVNFFPDIQTGVKFLKGHKINLGKKNVLGKHWKAKPFTEEHKLKLSISHKGKKFTLKHRQKIGLSNLGHKVSYETRKKISERQIARVKNGTHIWYKGGITPLRNKIYNSIFWKQWRKLVFTRDNWTCQECGEKGKYLEPHHIKSFSKIIEENNITKLKQAKFCIELWDINNGITLCKKCHNKTKLGIKTLCQEK